MERISVAFRPCPLWFEDGLFDESTGVALDPTLPSTDKVIGDTADPQGARLAGDDCEDYWDTPEATREKDKK